MRSRLLHGLVEGGVVLLAPDGALDLVRPCARLTDDPSEQLAGTAQEAAGDSDLRLDEAAHVAVAALVAEELELVTQVGGEVLVILGEGDHGHRVSSTQHSTRREPGL